MFLSRARPFLGACLALLLLAPAVLAQTDTASEGVPEATLGAFFAVWAGCICLAVVVGVAVEVAMLVFVYRDAQARGQDPTLWLILVFFTTWIGLIVWLIVRPEKKTY